MTVQEWILTAAQAALAAVLLHAGAAKLVTPGAAAAAAGALRRSGRPLPLPAIRTFAAVEMATALVTALPSAQPVVLALVIALGAVFTGAGLLGAVRGADRPCGCFGSDRGRPLGRTNVLIGLAFVAVGACGAAVAHPSSDPRTQAVSAALLTSLAACAWLLVVHRAAARTAFGNFLRRWDSD